MQQITLDLIPNGSMPVVNASQYDDGRVFRVNITENGTPYMLTDEVIEIHVRKGDGCAVTALVAYTASKSYLDIATTEQMTAVAGNNIAEINVKKNGSDIGSLNFILLVERDPLDAGVDSESVIHDLQAQVDECVQNSFNTLGAAGLPYDNTESGLEATNVQAAIDEVNAKIAEGPSDVYTKEETDALLENKADKSSVYTKTEADALLADKVSTSTLESDYYTKTETDTKLDGKANKSSVYTKTQTDTLLDDKVDNSTLEDYYSSSEVDALLYQKANKNSVYTKAEINTQMAGKANVSDLANYYTKSETYSKSQTDDALALKADSADVYDKTYIDNAFTGVNTALGTKADASTTYNKTEVDAALAAKADASDVTASLALKADKSDSYTKAQIDTKFNKIDPTLYYSVTFEQGTINNAGQDAQNANRIRSIGYFDLSGFTGANISTGYALWFYLFDHNKVFIGQFSGTNYKGYSEITPQMVEGGSFIRFVIIKSNGGAITPQDDYVFSGTYSTFEALKTKQYFSNDGTLGKPKHVLEISGDSDMTFIGDKLVCFSSSSDDLTTSSGKISVFEFGNGFDSPYTSKKTYNHYFGHCNTVDYNEDNGCLIFGNGSGAYTLEGKIIIISDFATILENAAENSDLTLSNTNAIVIDCTGLGFGSKFNVVWGEKNGTESNIAYLITSKLNPSNIYSGGDNGTVRRLLLGIGTNQLQYGAYSAPSVQNGFNGTFAVLDTYQSDFITGYNDANQGTCFANGKLVANIGHSPDILSQWSFILDNDGSIYIKEKKEFIYNEDGTKKGCGLSAICYYNGLLFFGIYPLNVIYAVPLS